MGYGLAPAYDLRRMVYRRRNVRQLPVNRGGFQFLGMRTALSRAHQRAKQGRTPMASTTADAAAVKGGMTKEERFVIFASSLGTIFEWYDFYLYAVLAPFFAALFFPSGNDTAALLSAFATYAAGFLIRPFGALIFGRIGDLVGRKYTFLVTIIVMGSSTFLVGVLPTFTATGCV